MIRQLHLKNFKCFVDVAIPFGPLTLLAGVNSSGKSTTIQSLLLLRQSWTPQSSVVNLNGPLTKLGHPVDVLSEDAEETDDADRVSIHVIGDDVDLDFNFALKKDAEDFEVVNRLSSESLRRLSLFGDSFQYLNAERLGPRILSEVPDDYATNRRDLGPSGEYTAHFLNNFGQDQVSSDLLLHPSDVSRSLLPQVESWLGEISPGVQLSVTEYRDLDIVSLGVSFTTPGQVRSARYRPTNVGFGLTYVLPVIVAILSAKPGDLLIIENPEAHLHPKGQARIGRLIALGSQSGIQIVVETHSDHVLNGIRIAAKASEIDADKVVINFFKRSEKVAGGSDVINPKVDADGRLNLWPRGFFDEWENSLDSLLG